MSSTVRDLISQVPVLSFVACAIVGAFAFSFKFGVKSSRFQLSLPITRKGHFTAAALTQLTLLVVPTLIAFVIMRMFIVSEGFPLDGVTVLTGKVWEHLAMSGISLLLFSAISTLSAVLAGNIFGYFAFYAALCYGYRVADFLMRNFLTRSVFGLYVSSVPPSRFVPLNYLERFGMTPSPSDYAIFALAALVIYAFALLIFRKQRAESAGDVVAVAALKPVLRVLAVYFGALTGFFLFGLITDNEFYSFGRSVPWVIAFALLGCLIVEMLLQKSLKVFSKRFFIFAGLSMACIAAVSGVALGGISSIEMKIPLEENVETALISFDRFNDYSGAYKESLRNDANSRLRAILPYYVEDRANIKKVMDLHRSIIASEAELRSQQRSLNPNLARISLAYRLNDGSVMERQYYIPFAFETRAQQELLNLSELNAKRFAIAGKPFTECKMKVSVDISGEELTHAADGRGAPMSMIETKQYFYASTDRSLILTSKQTAALYSAVRADVTSVNAGEYFTFVDSYLATGASHTMKVRFTVTDASLAEVGLHSISLEVDINKDAVNTLNWLVENGFFTQHEVDELELPESGFHYTPGLSVDIY